MVHNLMKSPDAMAKLRAEVDDVLGDHPVQLSDLPNLPYLTAVMRETLRLFPPAIARQVAALNDTTLCGGKYTAKAGETLVVHTAIVHMDPKVWGEDVQLLSQLSSRAMLTAMHRPKSLSLSACWTGSSRKYRYVVQRPY